jgi:hypothetical protein
LRHTIQIARGDLHLLVFQQAPHQFGTRIMLDALFQLFPDAAATCAT